MVLVGGEGASQEPLALGKASSPTSLLLCLAQSYLVKLEGHANPRCHHSVKQVHVSKDPLITRGGDAKVPLEQGMQAIEEGLQAGWGEHQQQSRKGLVPILPRTPTSSAQSSTSAGKAGTTRV